eukprot:m.240855 g.240855  ORF g.240855 m.240855 type:complete len:55 (+) comp33768_c5_seq9:490-654(+)
MSRSITQERQKPDDATDIMGRKQKEFEYTFQSKHTTDCSSPLSPPPKRIERWNG